jgi:hypothetical protein
MAESLDATGRWRLVEESLVGGIGARPRLGPGRPGFPGPGGPGMPDGPETGGRPPPPDPEAPSPQQIGKNKLQQERYRGLEAAERRARIWADIEAWADGRPVFWYARGVESIAASLPQGADYESVAEIDAPAMFGPGNGGRGGPAFPGRGPGSGNMGPPAFQPMGPPMMGPVDRDAPASGPGFGPRGGFAGGRGLPPRMAEAPPAKLRLVRIKFGKP